MLNKLQNIKKLKSQKGFTIIEVMVVLAIAGLIILVVLLAVPALQRNGRNTAIKNDASAIVGAVSEFRGNNDGATPAAVNGAGVLSGAGTDAPVTPNLQRGTTVSATATPAVGTIGVMLGANCPGGTGAPARSVAVYYQVEGSGTAAQNIKCIQA